jgi:hypothetical protein
MYTVIDSDHNAMYTVTDIKHNNMYTVTDSDQNVPILTKTDILTATNQDEDPCGLGISATFKWYK